MPYLIGDIGGTKTELAIVDDSFSLKSVERTRKRYASQDFSHLREIVGDFLHACSVQCTAAVFGVAGPVIDGRSKTTNLPWELDQKQLSQTLAIDSVLLLNDIHCAALGLTQLAANDLEVLQGTLPFLAQGPKALISVGTGLGEAIVATPQKDDVCVLATEGGHCDFAPRNDLEIRLFHYLRQQHSHVSYERIVSGPGIFTLYEFVVTEQLASPLEHTKELLANAEDCSQVVGQQALHGRDVACVKAVEIFWSILAAEAGNLALKSLPTGGLYIIGGIPPQLLPTLNRTAFIASWTQKGRMKALLESFPVAIVTTNQLALLGAIQAIKTMKIHR